MEDKPTAIVVTTGPDRRALATLTGAWSIQDPLPDAEAAARTAAAADAASLGFDSTGITRWDSALLVFLVHLERLLQARGITPEREGLPEGVRGMLRLAEAVPERAGARGQQRRPRWIEQLGLNAGSTWQGLLEALSFLGSTVQAFARLARGKARMRQRDVWLFMQEAGAEALPIVTLISFLVGTILAFVGAVQLEKFGATIYVANTVGVGMVREMGAMMTGIVMAGRTGAAYAAQLGSMKANQEIDALSTMGIEPLEFLVLPRMVALALMMPLLCLYSDFVGILGGVFVGVGGLGLSARTYYEYTQWAVQLDDLFGGLAKASVYGILIAFFGCLRGMQSGNSSASVGLATTRAVVSSIVAIVSACGIFAVVFYVLGL